MSPRPRWPSCLEGWTRDALAASADTVCVLDPELVIAWTNPAWRRFAAENGGEPAISERWSEGARLLDAVPEPWRAAHERALRAVRSGGRPRAFDYECSSPELYRRFHEIVYPAAGEHLVVVHALALERPHERERLAPCDARLEDYRDAHGLVHQCMHCRRTAHLGGKGRWDWIPAWVEQSPASTSHGLCPPCHAHYSTRFGD